MERRRKKITLWLPRSAEGLHTLQRTVAPNSCWLQYILKYLPLKKNGLEYLQPVCNWWELQNLSTTENQAISHAHWLPLMEATLRLRERWELCFQSQLLNEERFLFVSLLLVESPSGSRAGAVLLEMFSCITFRDAQIPPDPLFFPSCYGVAA